MSHPLRKLLIVVAVPDYTSSTYEELVEASNQLMALSNATRYQQLLVIASIKDREEWRNDVSGEFSRWLGFKYQIDRKLAADLVSVAKRLTELPLVMSSFAAGTLSWDQLVSICEYASADDDEDLASLANDMTLTECRLAAKNHRRRERNDPAGDYKSRSCRMWWASDRSYFYMRGRWDPDAGAVIENAAEALRMNTTLAPLDAGDSHCAQIADAITEMAKISLVSSGNAAAKPSVIVHVDASVLAGVKDGVAELENGASVDYRVANRLACEGRVQLIFDGSDGKPVGVGRQARLAPWWLERVLRDRDGGCRFPKCESKRFLHSHHIAEWIADNGLTNLNNMITLCWRHHHLLHDQGWSLRGDPDGFIEFVHPSGSAYEARLPAIRPDIQMRFEEWLGLEREPEPEPEPEVA